MSIRSTFGIDGFELFVHVVVTCMAVIALGPMAEGPPEIALGVIPIGSLLALSWRRRRGLASLPPETSGEVAAQRIYELEERVAELESIQFRLQDLEERLDFAERLLTQPPQVQDPRLLG